jgi:hypothetical protein
VTFAAFGTFVVGLVSSAASVGTLKYLLQ